MHNDVRGATNGERNDARSRQEDYLNDDEFVRFIWTFWDY